MKREEQKQEAIKRMKQLKIYPTTIQEFAKNDVVNKSEHDGILFWLNEDEQEMIKKFEKKHDAVVYHVIHNYTLYGELYSLLFVSKYKDDWGYDNEDMKENIILCYVVNKNELLFSEFGSIAIKEQYGGLVRVG